MTKNKKSKTTGLSSEDRKNASTDLTQYYFDTYWSEWRYAKVLIIRKMLQNKYSFLTSITSELYDREYEEFVAQEMTNGLYFDAISHCIQYVEDLFALFRASKDPDFFIKNIVTYEAGKVTNDIKVFKCTDKNISDTFHIPYPLKFNNRDYDEKIDLGIKILKEHLESILQFYHDYEFFYIQYKHGLSIPLRTLGNTLTPQQVADEKSGTFSPLLAAYDNFNLKIAFQKKTANTSEGIFMPGWTSQVQKCIVGLQEENNFLRLVLPRNSHEGISINSYVEVAKKINYCMSIFKFNYLKKITQKDGKTAFQIPNDPANKKTYTITYTDSNA